MIKNNIKIVIFASLMVAMILPFSVMEFAEANQSNMTKKIQKPLESESQKQIKIKVKALVLERFALMAEGQPLKVKYQENGLHSLTDTEKNRLEQIHERLNEISGEIKAINTESRKLYASTPEEKQRLRIQHELVLSSDIPFIGLGTDHRVKALQIDFQSQEIADQYIPQLDEMLSVPYYIVIKEPDVDYDCANQNSPCSPLIGGIEIDTEKDENKSGRSDCSISVPLLRNLSDGTTEEGFVTAGHCFATVDEMSLDEIGNDVKQPKGGLKIGNVTAIQNSGECDCAFVKTDEDTSTFFGYWGGYYQINELASKTDPVLGDSVIMIGRTSGIQVGQVTNINYHASEISGMMKVNHSMTGGDSGGIVIDADTFSVYQGLIKGGNFIDHTTIVPWSHIDNALDLQ